MDPLYFLEHEQLLLFFHRHKTVMSCMDKPQTFLSQLRDHGLIPEDRYQIMSRMKSKDNLQKALYEVLDWLERERSKYIQLFWECVFKETIVNQYPTLQLMKHSLMEGSFDFGTELPQRVEKEETDKRKRKELSEDEEGDEKKANSMRRKKTLRSWTVCHDEEERAGPSSQSTPGQRKKSKKICFSSPLKKGEKSDIWTWPIYKTQLPVTCGCQKGMLSRDRLAKGEKCILVETKWFTPTAFEKFAGKESFKNWKLSIRCSNTPLAKLIQEGHLKSPGYKRGCKKTKKSLFPSSHLTVSEGEEDIDEADENEECDLDTDDQVSSSSREGSTDVSDEDEESEEQTEQQPEGSHERSKKVFKVTCGTLSGTLHEKRFASGTHGKSIRTETSWVTPVEFLKEASLEDASWRKDIKWNGQPLGVLTEAKILNIHSLQCTCDLCKPDSEDLGNEKNDDECCICKGEGEEEELVMCDQCPRSFHQKCHLPHVEDAFLGDGSQWMCTFCIFRSYQGCLWKKLKREEALSTQLSDHMQQQGCQYLLLRMCIADEEQTFATNPSLYLEDYTTVIKTPMWLGKVADKLQKQLYQTVGEFVSDVQLIFTNCASYNRDNAEFLAMGNRMKELFDREVKSVFNICE